MIPIELVDSKGYPQSLRNAVNQCASRLNRITEISYEDVRVPQVIETEENIKIVLPRFPGLLAAKTPFNAFIRLKPNTTNQYQVAVWNGTLFKSRIVSEYYTITGLTTDMTDIQWHDVAIGEYAFLECSLSSETGSPTTSVIKAGDDFDATLDPWETDSIVEETDGTPENNRTQTFARMPIAKIVSNPSGGTPLTEQYVYTHLVLKPILLANIPAQYFTPW